MRRLGLIFSIAAVIFVTAAPSMAERRLALVVGNSAYRNTPSLENPKNDARAMAETLQRLGFKVIRGIDLTADGMRRTVRKFAGALQSTDVALFYYAGHGLQVNGQNYLVPIDAKMRSSLDLEFEATNLQVVIDLMEREAKTNLVFLDACRDNPLARTLARSLGASRSTAIGQGLARIESGIGTLIAYATEPGNVALDGDSQHSPFTEALLKHIKTPGLEIGRMLRRVRSTVLKKTNGKQVPWEHTSLVGDFYFGPRAAVATARPAAPPNPAVPTFDHRQFELAIWDSIKQSRKATDFERFLKHYPKSAFAPGAQIRLSELKHEEQVSMRPPPVVAKSAPPAKKASKPSPRPKSMQLTADFENYLKQYPTGAFAPWARSQLTELKREKQRAAKIADLERHKKQELAASNKRHTVPQKHKAAEIASLPHTSTMDVAADRGAIEKAIVSYLERSQGGDDCWGDINVVPSEECSLDEIKQIKIGQILGNEVTAIGQYTLESGGEFRAFKSKFVLRKTRGIYRVMKISDAAGSP